MYISNIDILLATYNGEKYIKEQIDSILNQTFKSWKLLIRDDGSTDNTVSIIEDYCNKYPDNIFFIKDNLKNLGAKNNFLQLIKASCSNYIMFSDQDDIWLPFKIELTFNKIKSLEKEYSKDIPIVVFTDLKVVDEKLNLISNSLWKYQHINPNKKNFASLLVDNVATGCTLLINKSLKDKIKVGFDNAHIHDWWIALIGAAFGIIDFVETPTILYRQHSHNSIGAFVYQKTNIKHIYRKILFLSEFKEAQKRFYKKIEVPQKQAVSFLNIFESKLSKKNYKIISEYINLKKNNFFMKKYKILKYRYFESNIINNIKIFFYY